MKYLIITSRLIFEGSGIFLRKLYELGRRPVVKSLPRNQSISNHCTPPSADRAMPPPITHFIMQGDDRPHLRRYDAYHLCAARQLPPAARLHHTSDLAFSIAQVNSVSHEANAIAIGIRRNKCITNRFVFISSTYRQPR